MPSPRVLLIDNYDSFTYNIYQLARIVGGEVTVVRNDAATVDELTRERWTHLIVGPGPKGPADSGISLDLMDHFKEELPILGICLGMQAMAHQYGGEVAPHAPVHGKKDMIRHRNMGVHAGIPSPFKAARYHSLAVTRLDTTVFETTAENLDGLIMGIRHRSYPLMEGVQYHPESFMTQYGDQLMDNFLRMRYEF